METLEQYESSTPHQIIDKFGRLIVDTENSHLQNGEGLKPLADYLHSRGLKLGIHIMRGIPIQAVEANTPIKGHHIEHETLSIPILDAMVFRILWDRHE